jgi:hypothetical protein
MKENSFEIARAKRDKWVARILLWSLIPFTIAYFVADGLAWLPAPISVRIRNDRRNAVDPDYIGDGLDPDLVLGIAIGDTRFRLNYGNGHAIVTRPIMGVTDWVIPAHFTHQGTAFTVVALDPFAMLYATNARAISLPHTLIYDNDAPALANACLERLILRAADGTERLVPLPCKSVTTP